MFVSVMILLTFLSFGFINRDQAQAQKVETMSIGHQDKYPFEVNQQGFTELKPSKNTKIAYISNSGNDAQARTYSVDEVENPFFPKKIEPYASVKKAIADFLPGESAWILFERGGLFKEKLNDFGISGGDVTSPTILAGYGQGPRPILKSDNEKIITTSKTKGLKLNNVVIKGLHLVNEENQPKKVKNLDSVGIDLQSDLENTVIEDLVIENFNIGIKVQNSESGKARNLWIRRNIISGQSNNEIPSRPAYGIYLDGVAGASVVENFVYNNGWSSAQNSGQNFSSAGIFIGQNSFYSSTTIKENIILDNLNYGLILKSGGLVHRNIFSGNHSGIFLARGKSLVAQNLISINNPRITTLNQPSYGIQTRTSQPLEIHHNIFTSTDPKIRSTAVDISGNDTGKCDDCDYQNMSYSISLNGNQVIDWMSAANSNFGVFTVSTSDLTRLIFKENWVGLMKNPNSFVNFRKQVPSEKVVMAKNQYYGEQKNGFILSGKKLVFSNWQQNYQDTESQVYPQNDKYKVKDFNQFFEDQNILKLKFLTRDEEVWHEENQSSHILSMYFESSPFGLISGFKEPITDYNNSTFSSIEKINSEEVSASSFSEIASSVSSTSSETEFFDSSEESLSTKSYNSEASETSIENSSEKDVASSNQSENPENLVEKDLSADETEEILESQFNPFLPTIPLLLESRQVSTETMNRPLEVGTTDFVVQVNDSRLSQKDNAFCVFSLFYKKRNISRFLRPYQNDSTYFEPVSQTIRSNYRKENGCDFKIPKQIQFGGEFTLDILIYTKPESSLYKRSELVKFRWGSFSTTNITAKIE